MASENETVDEAIVAVRKMIHECPAIKGGIGEFRYQLKANGEIDRIEAAHKREVAELRSEKNGVLKANASLAADNDRLRREVAELNEKNGVLKANASLAADNDRLRREVAELNEVIKSNLRVHKASEKADSDKKIELN